MKLKIPTLLLLILLFKQTKAQQYQHFTNWNRLGVAKTLSPNWELWVEGFYRQQNNYHFSKNNPFTSPLMRGGRLFLIYKKNHTVVGLSPIMYIKSYQLLGKEKDFDVAPNQELRSNVYVEQWKNFGKINLRLRLSYELRFLKSLDYTPVGRFRPRIVARYPVAKNITAIAHNDFMLSTIPNRAPLVYGINQVYLGLNKRFSKQIDLEVGYFNNFRKRSNLIEFDNENSINIVLQVKF